MKDKIKLFFCVNSLVTKGGGAEKIMSLVLNELIKKNFEINLITFDYEKKNFFYNFSKEIKTYKLGKYLIFKNKFLANINKIFILILYLKKIKPQISFGFMHSIYINLAFASIFSKSRIVACDHILPNHFENRKIEFFLIRFAYLFIDKFTVVSEQVKKNYENFFSKKVTVLENIIDKSQYNKITKSKKQKVILSIGRMVEQKNFSVLISAFSFFIKKNKNWKLIIIGDGAEKFNLQQQISILGLKHYVKLIPFTKNVNDYYKKSSLYVSTSVYESFGLTVAEALIHRLPCIAFNNCPGLNKIISNNKNGLLLKYNFQDSYNLSIEMDRLVNNKFKMKKFRNYYDPKFLKNNKKENVLKKWNNLIKELIK